jgi:diguanylate cyclase (GGDEF)-like protein
MDSGIQEKLQALFVDYTKKLPGKINMLEKQWQNLFQAWDQEKLVEFHRAVHSLCGSAGTYGYKALSIAARELEIYLKTLLGKDSVSLKQQQEIFKLLNKVASIEISIEEKKANIDASAPIKLLLNNKLVYVLDTEYEFINEVKSNLDSMEYTVEVFADFKEFKSAFSTAIPCAMIVDVDFLNSEAIVYLQKLQNPDMPISLFCTAKQGDLQTRLNAVRAGGAGFFQKPVEAFYVTKTLDQACGSSAIEPLRVMIVDDSQSLAEYYAVVLQEAGMDVRVVMKPLQMLDELTEFRPDLLLLDVYMPECSGLELAAVLRQEALYAGIPIIFLSTEEDRFKQLAALNLGGDDFLTKPILPQHLVAAVRSRAKRAGILSSYMTSDSLTGLFNHTNILQHLEIELARAARLKQPLSFILLDIDHFKLVNDTYGHSMGDRVLRKLSELLLTRLRRTDMAGRYGGEEFAIILPNTTGEEAIKLCAKLREKFGKIIFTSEDKKFHVTFSAGISNYPIAEDASKLVDLADECLYKAKKQGRNRELFIVT